MNEENAVQNVVQKQSIFKKIHNDGFTWHDSFFIIFLLFLFLMIVTSIISSSVLAIIQINFPNLANDGFWSLFLMYASTIFTWLVFAGYCAITKRNRPMFKALTPLAKGNTVKMLLVGTLLGFGENALGILTAVLHSDIHLVYDRFPVIGLIAMFLVVLIQSSSEEFCCRVFLYQRLIKGYRSPWVAIIGNAVIFMSLHLFNDGISAIPILHLVAIALLYSCFVYYFDSVWVPIMAHTAWNYTQNIIFGLPNSGIVSSFSIWKLEAARGQITFVYDPFFGVEGSAFLLIVTVITLIAVIIIGKKRGQKPLNIWENQVKISN